MTPYKYLIFFLGIPLMLQGQHMDGYLLLKRASQLIEEKKQLDSISLYVRAAGKMYIQSDSLNGYVTEVINLTLKMYDRGIFQEGIQLLKQTDATITDSGIKHYDHQLEVLYQIARGYDFLGDPATSMQYIHNNLPQLDTFSLLFADHLNLLGIAYRKKREFSKALNFHNKALLIRIDSLGFKHNNVGRVLNNIAVVYQELGLYNKALKYYQEAIAAFDNAAKNEQLIAIVATNMGNLYNAKGEFNQAIESYKRALEIYDKTPSKYEFNIANTYTGVANAFRNKSSYQEAKAYYSQALEKYQHLPGEMSENIANIYTNRTVTAKLQKEYSQAIAYQQEALRLYQTRLKPDHPRVINAANNLGIAYADNEEYAKALVQLQTLLPLLENDTTQRMKYANLCNDLADVHFKLKNLPEAKTYNQKALAIQQDLFGKKSYKLAYTFNSLAQIAEAEGNRDAALQYLQQALAANHADFQAEYVDAAPSPQGFYKYDYFVESLMHKARLMRGGGEQAALFRAKFLYETVDSVLTLVRNELLSSEDKIRLSEKFYELSQAAIENGIQLAAATNDPRFLEEAFRFSEKSKSNVLAQSIAANNAKQFAGIPDSMIVLEDQLQSDLNFYKQALAEQPDSLNQILYQNELFAAQQAYRNLITTLEKEYPVYYQLKYDQAIPRARAIQAALPENTALVSYFTGDSVLYSFVFTKSDFKVYRSPIDKNFYNQQVGLRKSITNKLNEDYINLAYNLHQQLFPFTLDKNIQSLVIIPDGNLSKLPFEALLSKKVSPRSDLNFSQLPYLVNDYAVSYALSATMYYQAQSTTSPMQQMGEGLLAYAPVFAEPQEVGFFSDGTRNPLADTETTRMMTLDGKFIAALPATAGEIEQIAEVFKQKGQKATTYLFKNANEKQFKQRDISQSSYLHIATHGFINETQPDLSGLLLFPDTTEREDHILYSGEVYNLDLNAQLVVLSACETGLGKVAAGEGLLGLSRAFFYAGADNLMVSLWKVQDQATADLMVSFYQAHLNSKNQQFNTPLRQAKLNLIGTENFSHPYYWSAFVLIGQ